MAKEKDYYLDVETQNFASLLRIIRKEHYLLNQSRNIHLISQLKKWDFLYTGLSALRADFNICLISQSKNGISYTIKIIMLFA